MIYLDNAATTRIHPEVLDAMLPYLKEEYGNAGAMYGLGRRAANAVAEARQRVARLIGCEPDQIIFTSGGSEANNLVFAGLRPYLLANGKPHIVSSAVEHDSVLKAVKSVCNPLCCNTENVIKSDFGATFLGVNPNGEVLVGDLLNALTEQTGLVSVMYVNNETGSVIDDAMTGYCTVEDIPQYKDVIDDCWSEIQSRQGNGYAGVPFKFPTLNLYTTIEPGELCIFAAEAKQGKSMFLLNEAIDLLKQDLAVLYLDSELKREQTTGQNNPHYGAVVTEETRLKISQSLKQLYATPENCSRYGKFGADNPCSKKIKCVELNREFIGIRAAAREMGIPSPNITRALGDPARFSAGKHDGSRAAHSGHTLRNRDNQHSRRHGTPDTRRHPAKQCAACRSHRQTALRPPAVLLRGTGSHQASAGCDPAPEPCR